MAVVRIADLVAGNEVYGQMRLGLGIVKKRRVDGYLYGVVPSKPQKTGPDDLTRWQGTVLVNNTTEQVLTVQLTRTDSKMRAMNRTTLMTDIHWSAFTRLRLISQINFEPHDFNLTFPANLEDAAFKPYKTFTEVLIPSYVTGYNG
jgi:hypothetical protein